MGKVSRQLDILNTQTERHVDMNDDTRAHSMVLRWIADQLIAGQIKIGDRLPPERALADDLHVSRTSVREAIRILEAMGLIRVGVGSGPDAGSTVTSDPAGALTAALRLHLATAHLPVAGIVEARRLLEGWAAAYSRPDSAALQEAADICRKMHDAPEQESFLDLDASFHRALVNSADNVVVTTLAASLHGSVRSYEIRPIGEWEEIRSRLQKEHEMLLCMFLGKDERASELVLEHIDSHYNHVKDYGRRSSEASAGTALTLDTDRDCVAGLRPKMQPKKDAE